MTTDVVPVAGQSPLADRSQRTVVVFDVLRATTTMTAALAAGVREIRIFAELEQARTAASSCPPPFLLAGERNARRPEGFDLGNSPGVFSRSRHEGFVLLMSTTNGTRAILSAAGAARVLIGALTNARAVARAVCRDDRDVTLICAGTGGQLALEDMLGAGAVIEAIRSSTDAKLGNDAAWIARELFRAHRDDLPAALRASRGGQNVLAAGLEPDIDFAANLNSTVAVGTLSGESHIVVLPGAL